MANPLRVGVIGCGKISDAYFSHMRQYPQLVVAACADLNPAAARDKALHWDIQWVGVDELLAAPDVDLILNLTIPAAHAELNQRIVAAGKHAYTEKPFALDFAGGEAVLRAAAQARLRLGSAPDTFLGSGGQTARRVIDEGAIGRPVAASAFMACHGHESWHPNPGFYYQPGGGPMFDMGPYYLTMLVNLLGPIQSVSGMHTTALGQRVASSKQRWGEVLRVNTPTHITGTMLHCGGAVSTIIMSFDIWAHQYDRIEIHGTEGSLLVPDPNQFDGEVKLYRAKDQHWRTVPVTHARHLGRGIGVADMAQGIRESRPHRADGALALHVVEAMEGFLTSARTERHVAITTGVARPAALPSGLRAGELD